MPQPLYHMEITPGTCWIGGWMDPRAVLDTGEEKNIFFLQGNESQFIFQPAVHPLYWLDYPNSRA